MDGDVSVTDTITLNVGGMTCESCESTVHNAIIAINGVSSASVSHVDSSAIVNSTDVSREKLVAAIRGAG